MPTDRHKQTKSKYTADRQIPGAFDGETITRRRLMTGITHGAGAVAAGAFALPALGFALGPLFEKKEVTWQDIGGITDFPDDQYVPVTITLTSLPLSSCLARAPARITTKSPDRAERAGASRKKPLLSSLSPSREWAHRAVGIGTAARRDFACRLPGVTGPIPQPLPIRVVRVDCRGAV